MLILKPAETQPRYRIVRRWEQLKHRNVSLEAQLSLFLRIPLVKLISSRTNALDYRTTIIIYPHPLVVETINTVFKCFISLITIVQKNVSLCGVMSSCAIEGIHEEKNSRDLCIGRKRRTLTRDRNLRNASPGETKHFIDRTWQIPKARCSNFGELIKLVKWFYRSKFSRFTAHRSVVGKATPRTPQPPRTTLFLVAIRSLLKPLDVDFRL